VAPERRLHAAGARHRQRHATVVLLSGDLRSERIDGRAQSTWPYNWVAAGGGGLRLGETPPPAGRIDRIRFLSDQGDSFRDFSPQLTIGPRQKYFTNGLIVQW
jgi:hypothetical protein